MLIVFVLFSITAGLVGLLFDYKISTLLISANKKSRWSYFSSFNIAITALTINLIMIIYCCFDAFFTIRQGGVWLLSTDYSWISTFGIHFKLTLDSMSLIITLLVNLITLIALLFRVDKKNEKSELNVAKSKKNSNAINKNRLLNQSLFYLSILSINTFVCALLMVDDMFLFLFLWEVIAIPFYFLISLWGRRDATAINRFYGVRKFIMYTHLSSMILMIGILSLVFINWNITGMWTFDYKLLMNAPISLDTELFLMITFLVAFFVRIPIFPLHAWFIEAHRESSVAGSIMITGLLTTSAIYGLIKFILPLFPNGTLLAQPYIMTLSLFTLFYSACCCFKQTDIKQLIAYVSMALNALMVSAIYCHSFLSLQGALIMLIGTSLSISALFAISGLLIGFYSTRHMDKFVALKAKVKYLSTILTMFIVIVAGLPGSAIFTGFVLIALGGFIDYSFDMMLMLFGFLILSYALIVRLYPIFYGDVTDENSIDDKLSYPTKKQVPIVELVSLFSILLLLFSVGIYPQWICVLSDHALNALQTIISEGQPDKIIGEG